MKIEDYRRWKEYDWIEEIDADDDIDNDDDASNSCANELCSILARFFSRIRISV